MRGGAWGGMQVYNPLSDRRTAVVRVPVAVGGLVVTDAETGEEIPRSPPPAYRPGIPYRIPASLPAHPRSPPPPPL